MARRNEPTETHETVAAAEESSLTVQESTIFDFKMKLGSYAGFERQTAMGTPITIEPLTSGFAVHYGSTSTKAPDLTFALHVADEIAKVSGGWA